MNTLINPIKFRNISSDIDKGVQRIIYHHPNVGKMGGWAIALAVNTSRTLVALAGLVENTVIGIFNAFHSIYSQQARKDLKESFTNLKFFATALVSLPLVIVRDIFNYSSQASENEKLKKESNWQPIHFAVAYNDTEVLKKLIYEGTDVDLKTKTKAPLGMSYYFESPLHLVVSRDNPECIKLLMQVGANANVQNTYEETPLQLAVMNENIEAIEALVHNGTDVNGTNEHGRTALHFAATSKHYAKHFSTIKYDRKHYSEIIDCLVKKGAKVDQADPEGLTPLMVAVADHKIEAIHALIRNGADVNAMDQQGRSVLHYAARELKLEVLEALMQYPQLNINVQDAKGFTYLHYAVYKSTPDLLQKLNQHPKLDVNVQAKDGRTALHCAKQKFAIDKGNGEVVAILEKQPDLKKKIKDGAGKTADQYDANSMYSATMTLRERIDRDILGDETMDFFAKQSKRK